MIARSLRTSANGLVETEPWIIRGFFLCPMVPCNQQNIINKYVDISIGICYHRVTTERKHNMNKKNVVTKEKIKDVADLIKNAIDYLRQENCGCCSYKLDSDLAIYVGWEEGYDPNDDDIIKSVEDDTCWAIVAAVKIRNDNDCYDLSSLYYPWFADSLDAYDTGITLKPDTSVRYLRRCARKLLEDYVTITNEHQKGRVVYNTR